MKELKKKLEDTINEYISLFEEKQEMYLDFWTGDDIGGTAFMADCYFDFQDIRYDLETNQEKGEIIDWHWHVTDKKNVYMNYSSWCMGAKHLDLNKGS